jgi:hypothetical protein
MPRSLVGIRIEYIRIKKNDIERKKKKRIAFTKEAQYLPSLYLPLSLSLFIVADE